MWFIGGVFLLPGIHKRNHQDRFRHIIGTIGSIDHIEVFPFGYAAHGENHQCRPQNECDIGICSDVSTGFDCHQDARSGSGESLGNGTYQHD